MPPGPQSPGSQPPPPIVLPVALLIPNFPVPTHLLALSGGGEPGLPQGLHCALGVPQEGEVASQKGRPPLGAPALISPLGHGLTRPSLAGPALRGGPRAPAAPWGWSRPYTCTRRLRAEAPVGADPPRQPGILKSSTLGGAAALLWAGASAPGGPWQRLVTPLVEVAGTWFSTLVAPAQGLATLPDAYQACWVWRGQRAGPANPGSRPCSGHGHHVAASERLPLDPVWRPGGFPRQGWPECGASRTLSTPCL